MIQKKKQLKAVPAKKLFKFTLIEVVAAIAILATIGLICGTAALMFYNGYQRTLLTSNRLKEKMLMDNIFDLSIRNMIPFKWKDENNESRFVFEGLNDELYFVTKRRVHGANNSALLFARIKLENEEVILEYSTSPILPWEKDGEEQVNLKREVILTNVREISFRYAESSEEEDESVEWLDDWIEEDHAAIPLAIQLKVIFNDNSSEIWMRRTSGVSAYSTLGVRETVQENTSQSSGNSRSRRSRQ